MKEFYGGVTLVARIGFSVKADNIDEAKDKVLYTECLSDIQFLDDNGEPNKDISIEDLEWCLIDKERRGNVKEENVDSFEIYEED